LVEGEIKSRSAMTWSLVIHCLLLVVIIIQVDLGAQRKKDLFESTIPTQNIVNTSIVVLTHPVKIKQEKIVDVEVVKDKSFNEQEVVKKSNAKSEVKNETKKQAEEKIKESIEKLPNTKNNDMSESKPPSSEVIQQVLSSKSTLMRSKKFLQQKISAAPTYQPENEGAGMSIMNNTLSQHSYNVIEEKTLKQKLGIKITCDSVASKTTALISTYTGGRVKCEKGPDLSSFIKQKEKRRFKYKLD